MVRLCVSVCGSVYMCDYTGSVRVGSSRGWTKEEAVEVGRVGDGSLPIPGPLRLQGPEGEVRGSRPRHAGGGGEEAEALSETPRPTGEAGHLGQTRLHLEAQAPLLWEERHWKDSAKIVLRLCLWLAPCALIIGLCEIVTALRMHNYIAFRDTSAVGRSWMLR